jgi:Holliday junction resolvase RusA-like endonuclease
MPIPHRMLNPNCTIGSLGGRMKKARIIKEYRAVALLEATSVCGRGKPLRWKQATAWVTVHPKTARRPDKDNFAASLKPVWDGFKDAGLLADDKDLDIMPVRFGEPDKDNPRVVIVLMHGHVDTHGKDG